MSEVLAFEEASRTFRGGAGVEGVTLSVRAGQITALIGLNGAGKTTLMRLALGMLRPQQGLVRLFETPLEEVSPDQWARVGAMVEVPLAYPELTVRQNLDLARLLRDGPSGAVEDAMAVWGLSPLADQRLRRLSLGNRQRVGLAAALQHDPRLIVLDEPSNSLDPAFVIVLRDQLTRRAQAGAAVLISSHHLDEVSRIADHVLLINAGRLIGHLDTTEPDLERAFFGRIRRDDEARYGKEPRR